MDKETVEKCAERLEAYALSLELQMHIGLPDPITALHNGARKIRELVQSQPEVEGDVPGERAAPNQITT